MRIKELKGSGTAIGRSNGTSSIPSTPPSGTPSGSKDSGKPTEGPEPRERLQESLLPRGNARLVIRPRVSLKVWSLLAKIDGKEWSGVTFFRVLKGSLQQPDDLLLEMVDFFLMDLGSSAFTSFKYTPEITEYQMEHPELIEDGVRTGCMHSHHRMKTFFSGEDIDDLVINTRDENVDFYLSTIVNVDGEWISRIAFRTRETVEKKISSRFVSKLLKGVGIQSRKVTMEENTLCMIPLEVVQEGYEDTEPRIEALKDTQKRSWIDDRARGVNLTELDRLPGPSYTPRQPTLFDKEDERDLTPQEKADIEVDKLLGALMMGTVGFVDGLDGAVNIFRRQASDKLGNIFDGIVSKWAEDIVNNAQSVISIRENMDEVPWEHVEKRLSDLMEILWNDYVSEQGDAESTLVDRIDQLLEVRASMGKL